MKIVLTGGPSAGKTVVAETILREFRDQVVIIPESASVLFRGGFPRGMSPEHIKHQQKAIFAVQAELEAIYETEYPGKLIICDRGTLDGLAYWPGSYEDFFKAMNTSMNKELKRYDFVFHLESAQTPFFDHTNPLRIEGPEKAREIDEKIKVIWAPHSKRVIIKNNRRFSEKTAHVLEFIRELLTGERSNVVNKTN